MDGWRGSLPKTQLWLSHLSIVDHGRQSCRVEASRAPPDSVGPILNRLCSDVEAPSLGTQIRMAHEDTEWQKPVRFRKAELEGGIGLVSSRRKGEADRRVPGIVSDLMVEEAV